MNSYETLRDDLMNAHGHSLYKQSCRVLSLSLKDPNKDKAIALILLLESLLPSGHTLLRHAEQAADQESNCTAMDVVIRYINEAAEHVSEAIKKLGLTPLNAQDALILSVSQIKEITLAVKESMDANGLPWCCPFFDESPGCGTDAENYDADNGGVLCCLSDSRCSWCRKRKYRVKA